MAKIQITQELVRERFNYVDGALYFKIRVGRRGIIGKRAGNLYVQPDGPRWSIVIDYTNYKASRIIFLYHHGYLPEIVDHIDRDTANDRIENLREVTPGQNSANRTSAKNSTSKYLGVHLNAWNRWMVQIRSNGKQQYLGCYSTQEEAARVYNEAAIKLHGEYANLNVFD